MIYYLLLIAVLVIVSFLYYVKLRQLKIESSFILGRNLELSQSNDLLQVQKIEYIQKVEQLSAKIEYLNQLLSETDKARKESFESAKSALFDLGSQLSKQLIEIHRRENQEVRELSEKNIAVTSEKFNGEFERLINLIGSLSKEIGQSKDTVDLIKQSLLSPSGAGKLAEITLENILKASGLRAKLDFSMQYTLTTSDNFKLRPDALIFLPSDNLMVIDAKASKFLVDELDSKNLSKTMNAHLKSLSSREYAENTLANFNDKGGDFNNIITIMFLPSEHAIEKLAESDHNFMEKAWASNIFPVGPAGLMNMLSFAKFQISDQMKTENHKIIIEEVKKLLQSVHSIANHSQKLGANIQSLVGNYDKFAASFNHNFLSKTKNIQKLGVDTGNKGVVRTLDRYQLVSSKSELIDAEVLSEPKLLEEV